MSIETICRKCSEEYDMRHGECPVCWPTVEVKVTNKLPPYNSWDQVGYLPFEVFGERFAVTRMPCALDGPKQWRATHIEPGVGVPGSDCELREQVGDAARGILEKVGKAKLLDAIARAKAIIAKAQR